jgi:hypothetical protein
VRAAAGGSTSGGAILTLIAVFYLVPILLIGPPPYPHSQYRVALLTVAVSSLIGVATQRLVADVRGQVAKAGGREQMLACAPGTAGC